MADEEINSIIPSAQQEEVAKLTDVRNAISADRLRIEATLQQHLEMQAQAESKEEQDAAKSPLAMVYELLGCEYATMHFQDNQAIPRYDFDTHPCIRGKSRPDQDCRDCGHVMYHRMGNIGLQLPMYEKRYPNAGMVVALTEEEADDLTDYLESKGIGPLTRHASKIHALKQALINAQARENEAQSRVLTAQQGYQYPSAPPAPNTR